MQLAVVLGLVALVTYLLTRTRDFGGDDTVYATAVAGWLQHGELQRTFIHPHHAVYNPLVALVAALWQLLFGHVVVLDAGAWVSGAAAAFVIGALIVVLTGNGIKPEVALLAAAVVATCGSVWRFATMMEVYTLAAAGVVLWLAALSRSKVSGARIGLGLAAAWLGHLILGLLVLPTVWCLRRQPRQLLIALAIGVAVPATLLVVVLALSQGATSPAEVYGLFVSSSLSGWLHAPDVGALLDAGYGLVVWQWYSEVPVYSPAAATWLTRIGNLAVLLLLPLLVLGLILAVRKRQAITTAALGGLLVMLPYWMVWDVGLAQHMLAALPLLAVIIALAADALPGRLGVVALAMILGCQVISNGIGSAIPQTQPHFSKMILIAEFVQKVVPEQGQVLAVGADAEVRLGLPYLASRHVEDLTLLVADARGQGVPPEVALRYWLDQVDSGRPTWALGEVFDPATVAWIEELGIARATWHKALQALISGEPITLPADHVALPEPVTLRPVVLRPAPRSGSATN
jgi:hypothetical protein